METDVMISADAAAGILKFCARKQASQKVYTTTTAIITIQAAATLAKAEKFYPFPFLLPDSGYIY